MPYKLSDRLNQDRYLPAVNLAKVGSVFIIVGIISLITAWYFSFETSEVINKNIKPLISYDESEDIDLSSVVGPITTSTSKEVYAIHISIPSLPENVWTFIEGQVLDDDHEYLFSFGDEFWHETGHDDEGAWRESYDNYHMKVTFPEPGEYYLSVKAQGDYQPATVQVKVAKCHGSSVPHLVFGLIIIIIGLVLNEIRNKTISTILQKMAENSEDDDE